jgi:hypothetical protein
LQALASNFIILRVALGVDSTKPASHNINELTTIIFKEGEALESQINGTRGPFEEELARTVALGTIDFGTTFGVELPDDQSKYDAAEGGEEGGAEKSGKSSTITC